jgi:protein-disulfide isomerase
VDGVETRVQFRTFPLSSHPDAQLAHEAAEAAREQGKFWEMHDRLFANQHGMQRAELLDYARTLRLDMAGLSRISTAKYLPRSPAWDQ